ncbi:hypothetical protein AB4037_16880 [Labrys sp. KB_33_2]|jgi:hypothetical protein
MTERFFIASFALSARNLFFDAVSEFYRPVSNAGRPFLVADASIEIAC